MNIVKRYKTLSLPIKAAIWFIAVNFFTKGISFITIPVFTSYLSTEEWGKVSIYLTYQGILINFATFEMYSGAYIRGILRYKDDVSFFTWSEQLLSTMITVVVFIISIPIMSWLILNAQIDFTIYILTYGYFLFFPAYQCWVNRKRFDYEYKPVVVSAIVYSIMSVLIPLLAVMKIDQTASMRIMYMLLFQVIFCLPFYWKNIHILQLLSKVKKVVEQWKFLISFQAPAVVHAFSYIILSSMDRIMIGDMVGNSEAGIYSVAVTIANIIAILSISANQVLKPWRYQKMAKEDYGTIRSNSSVLLLLFGLAIIFWILVAPDVMRCLFSNDYYQAVWVVPPVSMAVFFVFLYSMFVDVEEYYYKTIYTMYATTISAIANVVMNYFAIHIWGYVACAYTTLICYILLAALHLFWASTTSKAHGILIGRIFNVNLVLIFSIVLVGLEIIVTSIYEYNIIRYAVIVFVALLCVFNLKRLWKIFDDVRGAV